MEKNKRYSYDAGYKLKVIAYAEEHGNRAAERHFGQIHPMMAEYKGRNMS
jgi:hypothetical protein